MADGGEADGASELQDGSFLDHLVGTQAILRAWGCAEHVCQAGLFHSIFGTESFQAFSLPLDEAGSNRATVRATIGKEAEGLALVNCVMERDSLDLAVLAFHGDGAHRNLLNAALPDDGTRYRIRTRAGRSTDAVTHDPATGTRKAWLGAEHELSSQQLLELVTVHLADSMQQIVQAHLEQTEEQKMSHDRRGVQGFMVIPVGSWYSVREDAKRAMAEILGGEAYGLYERVQAQIRTAGAEPSYW
jgi:hypothetical protein